MRPKSPLRVRVALAAAFAVSAVGNIPAAQAAPPRFDPAAAEVLKLDPAIANGTRLGALLSGQATASGQVSLVNSGAVAKSSPASTPSAYADLTFTSLMPCRIYDSRPLYGGTGSWTAASTNTIVVGPVANYTAQGGSATDCGLNALIGPGKIVAVMASVTTVTPAANGFLTFFSYGGTNPFPYGVNQFYSAGGIGTAFVVMPTDLNGAVQVSGYTTKQVDVVIDVVGYFAKPGNIDLAYSTATTGNITKNGSPFIHNYGTASTFIGLNAGNFTTTGTYNTGTGNQALASNTTGTANSANGAQALYSNTTGANNTASGYAALYANTTGNNNTASGNQALTGNTTGNANTATGNGALTSNTIGNYNTASGVQALVWNTAGQNNTATGYQALYKNTTGNGNTASGVQALYSNTTGDANTAGGAQALYFNTTGANNTASGNGALPYNTTGSFNIGVGSYPKGGANLTTGNYNIAIGNAGVAGESGAIRVGTSGDQTSAFIAGIRGVTTTNNDAVAVLIDSAGQLGTVSSSRKVKDDIADMDEASSGLMKLRPVTFHYKSDRNPAGRRLQYGLIAEEVEEVYPGLVARTTDGQVETVMYQFLAPMLLNEYQKQQRRIVELERERQVHTAEIAGLKAAVAEIADLKQQMQHMARLLDQQRSSTVTAGLELK